MLRSALTIFFLSFFGLQLWAQSLDDTYQWAKEQSNKGNHVVAERAFLRVVFFTDSAALRSMVYGSLAEIAIEKKQFERAHQFLSYAINNCSEDFRANQLLLKKAELFIKNGQYFKAQQSLYECDALSAQQKKHYNFLLGTSHFGNGSLEKAESKFLALAENSNDSSSISQVFAKARKKLNPKKPKRARTMSYMLPGLGQLYAGDVKNSLNSAGLMAGLLYLYFNTVTEYGLLSGIITVLPWVSRYHIGGGENALRSMNRRQAKLKSRYYENLLVVIK